MNLAKVIFYGTGYGKVRTYAPVSEAGFLRLEQCGLAELAQVAADLLGEEQPELADYAVDNLRFWVLRLGARQCGVRPFLRETARALIWQENGYETKD